MNEKMRFKSKEELIERGMHRTDIPLFTTHSRSDNNMGYQDGINDAFKSFAERVEFYKKHKIPSTGKGAYLSDFFDKMKNDKEHQELTKKYEEYLRQPEFTFIMPDASTEELRKELIKMECERVSLPISWDDWLFDLCFKEIEE